MRNEEKKATWKASFIVYQKLFFNDQFGIVALREPVAIKSMVFK